MPLAAALLLFGLPSGQATPGPNTPTLGEILQRLQSNLDHYDTRVPSLLCEEHVLSQVKPDAHDSDTVTDSVFRLQRVTGPDGVASLEESREIQRINGQPAGKGSKEGPAVLSGAFEGGLGVVSLDQLPCMQYRLQPLRAKHPEAPLRVEFATALTAQNTAHCLLGEASKGFALVDPTSMQITHLEITTPHHVIVPGTWYARSVIGTRVLTVDYQPVVLGDEPFWLPSTISMRATSASGTFHTTVWSYQATYRDYHRLQVTSRIHGTPE